MLLLYRDSEENKAKLPLKSEVAVLLPEPNDQNTPHLFP